MTRTVQVALPVPLRQSFTYSLPEGMAIPLPGCRVRVPFGPRTLTGFVVEEPPPTSLPTLLKPLRQVLDREPLFPSDLLAFTRRLSDYYFCPWGFVLRSIYPSGLAPSPKTQLSLTDSGSGCEEERFEALKSWLAEGGRPLEAAVKHLGKEGPPLVAEALRLGWVEASERLATVRRRMGEDRVILRKSPLEVHALLSDDSLPKPFRKVLNALLPFQNKGYPEAGLLARMAKVPQHVLPEMAEAGLIEIFGLMPADMPPRPSPHTPTAEQCAALDAVLPHLQSPSAKTFLLYGITGSGKTEVYLRLIEAALAQGKTALYLVPEISLTSFLARRLLERLGSTVAMLHSSMTDKERTRQWLRARSGSARVMIGPRSALFAPLPDLGLIVVDEEHDGSYKQQEHPRYHARDMAVLRGAMANIPVVLGSATPSVESYYNSTAGEKYTLLTLSERAGGANIPAVEVVDMRQEFTETGKQSSLSRALTRDIHAALEARRQVVILRNRRGYATVILCRRCGKELHCPDCAIALTHHQRAAHLKCHYCGRLEEIPSRCPECEGEFLQFLGSGTERVEESLAEDHPEARIARMDRDAVKSAQDYDRLWLDFESGQLDLIVGTQMVAKGHDVHNVTLVGILSADYLLSMPDFRAAERTFQLITQSAGRAGRGANAGRVVLQSFHPDHYAVQAASAQDYLAFYEKDIRYRRIVGYPPFSALALLEIHHEDRNRVSALSGDAARTLRNLAKGEVKVLGPTPAFLARLEGKFRDHILLKSATRSRLKALLEAFLKTPAAAPLGKELDLEIDPLAML